MFNIPLSSLLFSPGAKCPEQLCAGEHDNPGRDNRGARDRVDHADDLLGRAVPSGSTGGTARHPPWLHAGNSLRSRQQRRSSWQQRGRQLRLQQPRQVEQRRHLVRPRLWRLPRMALHKVGPVDGGEGPVLTLVLFSSSSSSGLGGGVWGAPDGDQHNRNTPLQSFLPNDLLAEGM